MSVEVPDWMMQIDLPWATRMVWCVAKDLPPDRRKVGVVAKKIRVSRSAVRRGLRLLAQYGLMRVDVDGRGQIVFFEAVDP